MVIYMEQGKGQGGLYKEEGGARGVIQGQGGGGGRVWPTLGDIHGRVQPSDDAPIAVQEKVFDVVEGRVDEHGLGVVPATTLETHLVRGEKQWK